MSIEVKVPSFPESVADGTVVTWHKQAGDFVKRDETIVDIETDKVVFEVPAPEDGVLQEIMEKEGVTVVSGQLLAKLDTSKKEPVNTKNGSEAKNASSDVQKTEATPQSNNESILTPSARKLISENKIDASSITPTGKGNRILKEDVLRFIEGTSTEKTTSESNLQSIVQTNSAVDYPEGRPEKRVPMTRLRAKIAERLVEAQQTAAILSTFNEVNMKPIMDIRSRYKEQFEKEHGVRLGFMSFFVKASIEALKQFPELTLP